MTVNPGQKGGGFLGGSRLDALLAEVRARFPRYTIRPRSSSILTRWWGATFATTIGNVTYAPAGFDGWPDAERWALIRHEAVHTVQIHTWPLGPRVPWLNYVIYALAYVLALPVLWTMRARFECDAYTETVIAAAELGQLATADQRAAKVAWLVDLFSGGSYVWMWRRGPARAWASTIVEAAAAGALRSRWTA